MTAQTAVTPAIQANHTQASFSETELCAHWKICPRTAAYWRAAGKMPPHFRDGKTVRYLISAIEAHERTKQKTEPQK